MNNVIHSHPNPLPLSVLRLAGLNVIAHFIQHRDLRNRQYDGVSKMYPLIESVSTLFKTFFVELVLGGTPRVQYFPKMNTTVQRIGTSSLLFFETINF